MRTLACVSALVVVAPVLGAEVALVAGGRALPIVVPAGAEGPLADSARDLQHYVEALSGTRPEIVADDAFEGDGPALFVGAVQQATDADLPPEEMGPEAYAVRVRDGSVYFASPADYGASFAVSGFLQDVLGVRWFMPGPLGEYIPDREPGDLVVGVEDMVRAPDFSPRIWSGNNAAPSWTDWNRCARVSLTNALPYRQFQNNIYRIFPPDTRAILEAL